MARGPWPAISCQVSFGRVWLPCSVGSFGLVEEGCSLDGWMAGWAGWLMMAASI